MKIILFGLTLVSLVSVSFGMSPVEFGKSVGSNESLVNELRDACQSAKNPQHCFGVGLSISNAESNMCNTKTSHGCFGLVGSKGDKSPKDRVGRYNRFWHKGNNGFYFYGDRGQLPPTRYCTSEDSSGSKVGCPNGRINFDTIWNDYKKRVMSVKYNPPLDEGINELVKTHKQECRRVGNVEANEYVQIDTRLGALRKMIFPKQKSKLFICSNQ